MLPRLLLSLSLVPLSLALPQAHAHAQAAPDGARDLAYSVGASLGERLRQDAPGLQLDALLKGLQEAYRQEPLALSDERIGQLLAQYQAQADKTDKPDEAADTEQALAAERRFMAAERAKAGVREIAEGILVTVLEPGAGAPATADGRMQVQYVGKLPDGSVFDQSTQAQWFRLNSVIEGWRTVLPQMPVGAKWRVVIASAHAYGTDGAGALIPPNTPLTFDIHLLATAP
ncbi:FKBP-type peptidyl-prolyl cis-trans isomerase [Pseudomonas baltica]|uniref:Peptidyl-prolyl cis-trans isomerase n=1 Tax=Pseudomonas baltica TaxID=2762576 RepID=A0A7X1G809_9PSED|nr:FKBP-type peptidyl-prolyl cis-trans isomerase [Pseudomonas baltica]MBC2679429.1 FKBP-type peptidyl-prolyl cis-trans isomerase [Pseudomonas baltica]